MTHTPGPWTWGKHYQGLYGSGQDNVILHHETYEGMWLDSGKHQEANARLIAAAPDMLAALQALHDEIAEYASINNLGGYDNHVMKQTRDAIAKAKGLTP